MAVVKQSLGQGAEFHGHGDLVVRAVVEAGILL